MPIYAYRCDACGLAKDVLQKMSDDVLTDCPACGAATFKKQLTAAGFQLKGSGWYATDFKNGSSSGEKPVTSVAPAAAGANKAPESAPAKAEVAATPAVPAPKSTVPAASSGAAP